MLTVEISREPGQICLARWTRAIKRSALQDLLTIASQPGVLSLALGLPAPELFPTDDYLRAAARTIAEPRSLQYGPPDRRMKQHVVELMAQRGVECNEDEIFLTAGAQQGANLLARLLLEHGGQVLIEENVYPGIQQIIEPFEPEILTVPTDIETGMDVDAVEWHLERGKKPAFIYAISAGHNPLAVTMSAEKRERLALLARIHGVPIIEDDPYGFLYYETTPPPICAYDKDWTFYLGSFSKILAPALRAGWIVMPAHLTYKLSTIKEASDIDTGTFAQRSLFTYLDEGHLPAHMDRLRREYKLRRDTMLSALTEHFPASAQWRVPQSGLFVWVELNEAVDTGELLSRAVAAERVAFLPGHAFGVGGHRRAAHCLRLNFSNSTPERINDGIARLARVLNS